MQLYRHYTYQSSYSYFASFASCLQPHRRAAGLTQIGGDRHTFLLEGCLVYPNSPTFGYHSYRSMA